jgi:hypothetical protein
MDLVSVAWRDDPVLLGVFGYWQSKRRGRPMPARSDIDPLELGPKVLPHILLTETVRGQDRLRFRFRLAGTAVIEAAGLELTGRFVDTLNPNKRYAAYIDGLYHQVMAARRPVFSTSVAFGPRSEASRLTRHLMCPLSTDGVLVDMFLTGQTSETSGTSNVPSLTYAETFSIGPTVVVAED